MPRDSGEGRWRSIGASNVRSLAATENDDLQPLALAHELWAEALFERNDDRANEQLERACAAWERYGARGIAARVRQRLGR